MAQTRQQIVSAIQSRLQGISVFNGYYTDLGTSIWIWRRNPWDASEVPGASIADLSDQQEVSAEDESIAIHRLQVEIRIVAKQSSSSDTNARQIIADVEKAISTDDTWGGLAQHTLPLGNEMMVAQDEVTVAGAVIRITVEYLTAKFSES